MRSQPNGRVTGHVWLYQGKRGGVWYAKYRGADAPQKNTRLGPAWTERGRPPAGYFTKRTAEEALREILVDAKRGTLAGAGEATGKTFADACEEWLRYSEHERGVAHSTLRDYRNVVNGCLYPEFGEDTPIEEIDTERLDAFRGRLLMEGKLSRRSVQKAMVLLHGILKRAKRRKWIATNPADDAERVTVKRSGDFNVLTPDQVYAVTREAESEQDAALIVVAAFTGLRQGELRALRWDSVHFDRQLIRVREGYTAGRLGDPKSGKVRSVPLIDEAAKELDRLSRREHFTGPADLVFPSPTGAYCDDKVMRDAFYDALAAAGLGHLREKEKPIVFHDLRHTFGTLGATVWPLHDLQAFMGHADIQTTMVYVHHVPKASAADELGRAVSAAIGVNSGDCADAVTSAVHH